jgi:hypothetical protein
VKLPGMEPAEWTTNIIALAALLSSASGINVTRDMASQQITREQRTKAMNYAVALRFDLPCRPAILRACRTPSNHES